MLFFQICEKNIYRNSLFLILKAEAYTINDAIICDLFVMKYDRFLLNVFQSRSLEVIHIESIYRVIFSLLLRIV